MNPMLLANAPFIWLRDGLNWRWHRWQRCRQLNSWRQQDRRENQLMHRSDPVLLFVSEAGQEDHFYRCLLEWMAIHRPVLRSHVRLDRLPCNVEDHGNVALLHAWVQDPVRERDALLWAELQSLEAKLARNNAQIVQPAHALSNSERVNMMQRLSNLGARVPEVVMVDKDFQKTLGGLALPVIVRPRFGHGEGMQLLETAEDLQRWWPLAEHNPSLWVALEYIDVQDDDGYYRKYRYLQVGDEGMPRHLMLSVEWEVRPEGRLRSPAAQDEELRYLAAPVTEAAIFHNAGKALQFDVAAFDYSYDSDGNLVIWEANPYPDISVPNTDPHPQRVAFVERSWALYCDYYARRAGLESC